MIYVFDLDGTLCTKTEGGRYEEAQPYPERIAKVQQLRKEGHVIIIDTARNSETKDHIRRAEVVQLTRNQLDAWGIKCSRLSIGSKVYGDVYVDDKAVSDKDFFGGV